MAILARRNQAFLYLIGTIPVVRLITNFFETYDTENILEKVKAGDTDALKIIYERYSSLIRSICINITKEDEDTINDLAQDSFILTYYSLDKLKDASKFKEWCAAITKNVALKLRI